MRLTLQEGKGSKAVTTESQMVRMSLGRCSPSHKARISYVSSRGGKGSLRNTTPARGGETDCRRLGGFLGIASRLGKAKDLAFKLEDARPPFPLEDGGMWEFFEPKLRQR
jgi:hypothetical protein